LLVATAGQEPARTADNPVFEKIAETVAIMLPEMHLLHLPLDDSIARRALDNYLEALDPERVYFLKRDIDEFNKQCDELDDQLKLGNVQFAFKVFEVFRARFLNRYEYVQSFARKNLDLSTQEKIKWKRKDAQWCATEEEYNRLWDLRLKNMYIQRLVAMQLEEEEAREKEQKNKSDKGTDDTKSEKNNPSSDMRSERREKNEQAISTNIWNGILNHYKQLKIILDDHDAEWIFQLYLSSFARAYDPHCEYMSQSTLENFEIEMKLSLTGIGALLTSEDGAAKIESLIPGGPAERDKRDIRLRPGDKIIGVGQEDQPIVDTLHWPLRKVVQLIRGKKGTKVVLKVIPASDPTGSSVKIVDLIRDEIKLEERAAKSKIYDIKDGDGNIRKLGVIKVPSFYADIEGLKSRARDSRSSTRDVARLLRELNTNGVEGIVLDLRNNPGGSLAEARTMTGLFIKSGPVVLVRDNRNVSVLADIDGSVEWKKPVVVLVNRQTASAAEILAAALQDYGRAIVVGDAKTHGKGTVQTVMNVSETEKLGSVKMTTALFYRITGSSTQLKGVSADITIPSPGKYLEIGEDFLKNPLPYDQISGTRFMPVGDMSSIIFELEQRSRKRIEEDKQFQTYLKLLEEAEKWYKEEEISLNLTKRIEIARTIRDIQKQLARLAEEEDSETSETKLPESPKQDIVLKEALNILADLIQLSGKIQ
jgi:carboxyl-terminal processing protease